MRLFLNNSEAYTRGHSAGIFTFRGRDDVLPFNWSRMGHNGANRETGHTAN
ncbi:MAG: hypothetical protein KDF60_19290 [Calditrichaeota bacterium]|nr:hypothetical protein [Calditrichota bacterium]